MKLNKKIKCSLIIFFIFVGLLFIDIDCWAASPSASNSGESNVPSCTYTFSSSVNDQSIVSDVTIAY